MKTLQASADPLFMFVIYKNPDEYAGIRPELGDIYIVRKWEILSGVCVPREAVGEPTVTLEAARLAIPGNHFCMSRDPQDVPSIEEIWAPLNL